MHILLTYDLSFSCSEHLTETSAVENRDNYFQIMRLGNFLFKHGALKM